MIDPLLDLPPHVRERLATALESGLLPAMPSGAALRSVLGNAAANEQVRAALETLNRLGGSGRLTAHWLRGLAKLEDRLPRTDLVWSGPQVPGLHARDTRRVYEELLGSAERSIWVSTYAFFDGPRAFAVLARRLESVPELRVILLLNIQRRRGDTTASEELIRRFAERFWNVEWPGRVRPAVFYDPRALDEQQPSGVLHAKAIVADGETVFVTSANLTEAALDRNIELGVLIRDRALAAAVVTHFRALIDRRILRALPSG